MEKGNLSNQKIVNILKFWRDIELFELPKLPQVSKKESLKDEIRTINLSEQLPWESGNFVAGNGYKWAHWVYIGLVDKENIVRCLTSVCNSAISEQELESISGNTCFLSFSLDQNGNVLGDSYVVASFIYALSRLLKNKDTSGFENYERLSKQLFEERWQVPAKEENDVDDKLRIGTKLVSSDFLLSELSSLFKDLEIDEKISGLVSRNNILVRSKLCILDPKTNEYYGGTFSNDILNSFFQADLNNIATSIDEGGTKGKAFKAYFSGGKKASRIDLLENNDEIANLLSPDKIPQGRWPSKSDESLFLHQQIAVNYAFEELKKNGGLISVNGPPGTGKTTLLRDMIAAILTERAISISNLKKPQDIFVKSSVEFDRSNLYIPNSNYISIEDGIVIASNNNEAVANVSVEIPTRKAVSNEFEECDYFSDIAENIFNEECWGMISAKLGKAENRSKFLRPFWFNNPKKDESLGDSFRTMLWSEEIANEDWNGRWSEAKKNFLEKLKIIKSELSSLSNVHIGNTLLSDLELELSDIIENTAKIKKHLNEDKFSNQELQQQKESIFEQKSEARTLYNELGQYKPGILSRLFKTYKYKNWIMKKEKLLEKQISLSDEYSDIISQIATLKKMIVSCEEKLAKKTRKRYLLSEKINSIKRDVKELQDENIEILDSNFWEKSRDLVFKSSPYMGEKLNRLRSELFLSAMKLHKATILANRKKFASNLSLFVDLLTNNLEEETNSEDREHLWASFFFVVPVVSTTLASIKKMFSGVRKNKLGWLFIDEAGQATCQSVTGAIWRSKRVLVVGDPQQTEPITTVPKAIVKILLDRRNLEKYWSPYKHSAQVHADRATKYGTYLPIEESENDGWSGLPLRVHLRCDDPMFSISNIIAYSNQMVKYFDDSEAGNQLGESKWFDISGEVLFGHAIKEEIELLLDLLHKATRDEDKSIYIITPFKTVSSAIYQHLWNYKEKKIEVGTIHKFQGKEADIVFLVLGGDPRNNRARYWASRKPNILNVAVTRAKKKLYVIGNRKVWKKENNYSVLANMLPAIEVNVNNFTELDYQ